jgi:hypothetical protein
VGGVLAVVLLVAAVGVLVWTRMSSTTFEEAVERLPGEVVRAGFTDWRAVKGSVPGSDLSASSSVEEMQEFLDRAFDKDLTTASALSDSFPGLAANYGITPLDAEWEAYGQAETGSVDVLKMSEDVDVSALEKRFEEMGYEAPAEGAGTDGVWVGTPELVVRLDEPLSPLQENVAVLAEERLLLMSDSSDYLSDALSVEESLAEVDGVAELVGTAGKATVAMLWADDFACRDLAMSQADPTEDAEGDALVEEAGGIHPLEGLVMAQQADSTLSVAMVFETEEQASDNLQPRTDLASGPAPGQGGTFSERFRVTDSVAEGRVVRMTFDPAKGTVLGDLSQGPVLFATC